MSFLSLTARVSADDKAMFRDEWKRLIIDTFPKINYRWFIRVFCWRFLEISSRIAIMTLTWINLGGISIFIIVGLEIVYLVIVCYGLGTLSCYIFMSLHTTEIHITRFQ